MAPAPSRRRSSPAATTWWRCPRPTLNRSWSATAARQEEGERLIAYYKERDRQREEREAKEACDAFEREVAERNRRAG
jgi:hypothetical protein